MTAEQRRPRPERRLTGQSASPGLAAGRLVVDRRAALAERVAGTPAEERAALDAALAAASERIADLAGDADAMGGEILEFQLALLEDSALSDPAYTMIDDGAPAPDAWASAIDAQIDDYEAAGDDYFRARADDLRDLKDRVLARLADAEDGDRVPGPDSILVAADLTPSRFLEIDWIRCLGAAVASGSASSHVAMLARARGVPLVVGLDGDIAGLETGAPALLDAVDGTLTVDPEAESEHAFAGRLAADEAARAEQAAYLDRPAATAAGEAVAVLINVDDPALLDAVDPGHCDGIGLTRTEFLFYDRDGRERDGRDRDGRDRDGRGGVDGLPDEETQYRAYARLVAWAEGRPVTVRTLDAGGDKPLPGLTAEDEADPFLGLRGLRLSLARPDVFKVQLRALARAAVEGPLKIMVPMVTAPEEMAEAAALLDAAVSELEAEGVAARRPELGMMVEVPAAALSVDRFDAAFFSIGSNDLVQYVTAAGRGNRHVARVYDPRHPAVLELIARVASHGRVAGVEVSLCGDMAGDPELLGLLLDAGLRTVSVAPSALARTKAAIAAHGGGTG
ncbi:MAG: putative PEP-binding protein [Azospirillaceae bacterium]